MAFVISSQVIKLWPMDYTEVQTINRLTRESQPETQELNNKVLFIKIPIRWPFRNADVDAVVVTALVVGVVIRKAAVIIEIVIIGRLIIKSHG